MLEWSGNSLDLSRMENSWQKINYLMKQNNTKHGHLKNQLKKVWCQVCLYYFRNLSVFMLKHLQMVVKYKGNMTKY